MKKTNVLVLFHHLKLDDVFFRLSVGIGWSFIGTFCGQLINITTMVLIANIIDAESYGKYLVVHSTTLMAGVLAGFGVGATLTRYFAALKISDKARVGSIAGLMLMVTVLVSTVTTFGFVVFSNDIALEIYGDIKLKELFNVCGFAIFFVAFDSYFKSALIGLEAIKRFAVTNIVGSLIGMPILLIGAEIYGLLGVVYAFVLKSILQSSVSYISLKAEQRRQKIPIKINGCLSEWKILTKFAFPALVASLMVTPTHWGAQAILVRTNVEYLEIAILGIAMQWFFTITFISSVTNKVVGPMMTGFVANQDRKASIKLFCTVAMINFLVAAPLIILFYFLKDMVIGMYGVKYESGSDSLFIAVCAAGLYTISSPVTSLVAAREKMWFGFIMNLFWAILYLSLCYLLKGYGSIGIVTSLLVAYALHALWANVWSFTSFAAITHIEGIK